MPLETMWRLTQHWYGDRLDPGFERRSIEGYQSLLDAVGLNGPFWRLA